MLNPFLKLLRRQPAVTPPCVPPPWLVYAVGDVHGESDIFERLLAAIATDAATIPEAKPVLVLLGDYVDRGADSRAVIERLAGPLLPGFACHRLRGNHEAAMLEFLRDPIRGAPWLAFGGVETLASYGVRVSVGTSDPARCRQARDQLAANLPDHHRGVLDSLKTHVTIGDYFFVHAGIHPGRSLARQRVEDMLWIREPFLGSNRRHEKMVVHGHTIVTAPEIRTGRIGIDTGAYVSGTLTALVLWGKEQRFLSMTR
jgi:serine/threonine protein phosphatase 1